MQLSDDIGDIRLFAILLKTPVDDIDRLEVSPAGIDAFDGDAGLELREHRPAHHFKAFARLVVFVGRLLGCENSGIPGETGLPDNSIQRRAPLFQEGPYKGNRFTKIGQQFLIGPGRLDLAAIATTPVISRFGKGRQRLAQVLQDAAVIDDHPVVLALVDPVRSGNGLHQGVRFERLVQVQGRETGDIKPGHPHGADDGHTKRVIFSLKCIVQRQPLHVLELRLFPHRLGQVDAFLDQTTVRGDVQLPFAELLHLALFLADHHRHLRLPHPLDLTSPVLFLLLVRGLGQLRCKFADSLVPVKLDQLVHADTGDLVDADQHRLAGFPRRGVVLHEITGHLVEAFPGRDDVVVALELLLQALLHVDISRLQFLQLLGDPLVQITDRYAELVATRIVIERYRCLVLHGPLEIVGGDVIAEHPPGDLVALEERRAGETDIAGVGQGIAHVERQGAVLGAVGLVGDDDEVVAPGVGIPFANGLVEFLDQRKDMGFVLGQKLGEMLAARGPARITVVVHHAASGKGLVDLCVQVVAVGEDQKGEVAAQLAMDLASEEHHGIALARTLGMPEHPQLAVPALPVADRLDGPVDAQELVVAGHNFSRVPGRVVENDEVLHQVQEIGFRAHPLEQRLHGHHTRLILGQPFPLMEMFEPAGERAEFGIHPIGQHH